MVNLYIVTMKRGKITLNTHVATDDFRRINKLVCEKHPGFSVKTIMTVQNGVVVDPAIAAEIVSEKYNEYLENHEAG